MGTSANLTVLQGDRHLSLHTSYDGYPSRVLATVAAPIALLGIELLRKNFASSQLVDMALDHEEKEDEIFRESATAYIEACQAKGAEPFDIEGLLHYRYGQPDFAHHGGGLLYGPRHAHQSGFVSADNPISDSDFVLDLDAGTLSVNYGKFWTVDLEALSGRDPDHVFDFLHDYEFSDPENNTEIPGLSHVNALEQDYNQSLNQALAELPELDLSEGVLLPNTPRLKVPGQDPISQDEAGTTRIVRVHPEDFLLIHLLAKSIQQASLANPDYPAFQSLVSNLRIERNREHAGLVIENVPAPLVFAIEQLGDRMVDVFGALTASLHPSGGLSVRHAGGSYASSGWVRSISAGFPSDQDDPDEAFARPKPEDLSAPFSMDHRFAQRAQWIQELQSNTAGDRERLIQSLQSETFLALATLDPQAYAQLTTPDVVALTGPVAANAQGAGRLAADMASVESMINDTGVRARYEALPQEAKDLLLADMDVLVRHKFHSALGLPTLVRRPKGP